MYQPAAQHIYNYDENNALCTCLCSYVLIVVAHIVNLGLDICHENIQDICFYEQLEKKLITMSISQMIVKTPHYPIKTYVLTGLVHA